MQSISVIGAGTMGSDVAQVFAQYGFDVIIRDISEEAIEKSAAKLEKSLARSVERGRLTSDERDGITGRMKYTTRLEETAESDLVVETIVENVDFKKGVFQLLESICKPETIFATNTSSLSITELMTSVKRRDKFIGMHFFNPATSMKLVEVIRSSSTSDETFKTVYELTEKIGKIPVEVQDSPGFIVNKILIPMINDAICVLEEGVASKEDIDKAMQLGVNHPMGPLALADMIGIDVVLNIMNILFEETGDQKFRPSLLLKRMVRGGLLGKKSGKGFYEYAN